MMMAGQCSLLLLLLGLLSGVSSSLSRTFRPDETLRAMALDSRGRVYIGAVNALYQLDADLNLLFNKTITGPVQDNPNCTPPQLGDQFCLIEGSQMRTSDNYNQLLLVNEGSGQLISCGSVYQGTCEARRLEDISLVIPESASFLMESYVTATDQNVKSVGFIDDVTPGNPSLYIAGYVSRDDDFTKQADKEPAVANRKLVDYSNKDDSFSYYTNFAHSPHKLQRSWHVKAHMEVNYVAAFSRNGFAYYVFSERPRGLKGPFQTRLARTCLSDQGDPNTFLKDSTYTSYIEIPLTCSHGGDEFPTARSVSLAPVEGFYEGGTAVLVGVFSRGQNLTRASAICAFSFDKINERLDDKVKSCTRGEGFRLIKSESISGQKNCIKSKSSTCDNVCTCNIATSNYPLEVDSTLTAVSAALVEGEVTAATSNSVQRQIELFLGVSRASGHSVEKFVLETPDRTHHITEFTTDPVSTRVVQLEVQPSRKEILIMTENLLFSQPFSVCSSYVEAGCHQCLQVKDPHCGWCEMDGRCSTEDTCGSDLWRTDGECTTITEVVPAMVSMGNQRQGSTVTLATNNAYPEGMELTCVFGGFGERTATVMEPGKISCEIPYQDPPVEGKHVVDLSIVTAGTGSRVTLASAEASFTFFNCDSYTSCSSCTAAGVGCGWCAYANSCAQICDNISTPEQCPALIYTMTHIPADFPHHLEVEAANLPQPFAVEGHVYECVVEVGGEVTKLRAEFKSSSKLVCATNHTFRSAAPIGEITVPIKVTWNGKEVEPADRAPEVDLYRCDVLGQDCSSCRANDGVRKCGWCGGKGKCLLKYGGYDICDNNYSSVCEGLAIESFEPTQGPIAGGTRVTIRGTNLGSRPSDITSVKIAGIECTVLSEGFEVSRAVVCQTGETGSEKHGLVEVVTSGDQTVYPSYLFYYKSYKVTSVEPHCAIEAGGSELTISGANLHIGRQINVYVGGAECTVSPDSPRSQSLITCTTQAGVVGRNRAQVRIDGAYRSAAGQFEVVPNPLPLGNSTSINSSIVSGGVPVTVKFGPTARVECVQRMELVLETVSRNIGVGSCSRGEKKNQYVCGTPSLEGYTSGPVTAHLRTDNNEVPLGNFTLHPDPHVVQLNLTNPEEGYLEWPLSGGRELVINGFNLTKVPGIAVRVGGMGVAVKATMDHLVLMPPTFRELQEHREALRRQARDTEEYTTAEEEGSEEEGGGRIKKKQEKEVSSEYLAEVVVTLGNWEYSPGILYYNQASPGGLGLMRAAIIIPMVVGFIVLIFVLSYVGLKYQRSQRVHRKSLKELRLHMEKLEMRVAEECKDAFTALQTHLIDMGGDVADIPFRPFHEFMANVLFPGHEPETRDLLARLNTPPSKVVESNQLSQFKRLLRDREFLLRFVETVESDPTFDVSMKCKMASLLVIAISDDMHYLTEVLFILMERLIEKFLAKKNHPQLLLRRTESVADKLLTHWLNYCCFDYLKHHAGKSIFTLFSAIKQQLDLGPQDEITFEAKSSLNNEKMLRETIEFRTFHGTVRDLNLTEHPVSLLSCDSIRQVKRKCIEAVHRSKPASQLPVLESFDLMYVGAGKQSVVLRENRAPIIEGWRKLSTLDDFSIENLTPVFIMVPLSVDSENSSVSVSPQSERKKSFLTTKRYRSKGNLISVSSGTSTGDSEKQEERHQVYHLVRHAHDVSETDELLGLSNKMMSEVFLTRLLSTKGTLQPYVDDLLNSVFMARERVPLCIKYLFDFLERQAQRHNCAHNQAYIHTWKNNSLSLRFWMNVLKNPHFLLDITQTPTIDSSLNIICGVFMDSCSTSDKGLTKDSPINKLLYAKEIPKYKKKVQHHYEQVSSLPRCSASEFLSNLPLSTGLSPTVASEELLKIAKQYQKQLHTVFVNTNSPSLNLKFTSVIDPNLLTAHHMV